MKKIISLSKLDCLVEDEEFVFGKTDIDGIELGPIHSGSTENSSIHTPIQQVIESAIDRLLSEDSILTEHLNTITSSFCSAGVFRDEGKPLSVHVDPHAHGHHRHMVSSDFPQSALSLIMQTIDKELVEMCLCAPIDLDELGGAVKHAETAVGSLGSSSSEAVHSHTILDHPSGADIGLAVGATYFALFGLYFGCLNIKNGYERLHKLHPYLEKVTMIVDQLEKVITQMPKDNPARLVMGSELKNMKAYLGEIQKSRVDGAFQMGTGVGMAGGSGAVIGSLFLATLTPVASIFFATYGLAHVAKYSILLGRSVTADYRLRHSDNRNHDPIKAALDPFLHEKYKIYTGLIGCFSAFTASSVILSVGTLAGGALVGGPIGLGVSSAVLVAAALSAAYLNNVSANRFAPKNQDYQTSRLLWGNPQNVASRMVACRELRDIAGSFSSAPSASRHVKPMDHVKCFGYWTGTVATLGTLPKFSTKVRDFKTRYDVSRSLIKDDARQTLVKQYCNRLISSSEEEVGLLTVDIKQLIESINIIPKTPAYEHLRKILVMQLVLKQLACDKLKDEISKAKYVTLSLNCFPGVAYSEFLKLTHMDVKFIETLEVMKVSGKVSDQHRTQVDIEHSHSLSYLGGCGHSHSSHKKHHTPHHHDYHSQEKPFEISYDLQDAIGNTQESQTYLAAFDFVIKKDLKTQMDEQWVKRGNHLETMILLK